MADERLNPIIELQPFTPDYSMPVGPGLTATKDFQSDPFDAEKRQAALNLQLTRDIAPPRAAVQKRLRTQLGIPMGVTDNLSDAQLKEISDNPTKYMTSNSILARYLANDPYNAAISRNDVAKIDTLTRLALGWQKGRDEDEMAVLAYELRDKQNPQDDPRIKHLQTRLQYLDKTLGTQSVWQRAFTGAGTILGQQWASGADTLAVAGATATTLIGASAFLGPKAVIPAIPLALGLGMRAGVGATTHIREKGNAILGMAALRDEAGNAMDIGTRNTIATGVGFLNGMVEAGAMGFLGAAMQMVPNGAGELVSRVTGMALAKAAANKTFRAALAKIGIAWVRGSAIEIGQENLQEVVAVLGEFIAKEVSDLDGNTEFNPTVKAAVAQAFQQMGQINQEFAPGIVLLGAGGAGISTPFAVRNVVRGKQTDAVRGEVNRMLHETETGAQSPEAIEELMNLTELGRATAFIPGDAATALLQDNTLGPELSKVLDPAAVAKAAADGTDVWVAESKLQTLPPEVYKAVLAVSRLDPGGMSALEIGNISSEDLALALEGVQGALVEQGRTDRAFDALTKALLGIRTQLRGVGFSPDEVTANLAPIRAKALRFRAMGGDPVRMLNRITVSIVNDPQAADDIIAAALKQTAEHFQQAVTPVHSAEYSAAVEAGDAETAGRLVQEAAERAGYNVGPVFHGSPRVGFNTFEIPSKGFNSTIFGHYEVGRNAAFFTADSSAAEGYRTQGGVTSGETRSFFLQGDYRDIRNGISEALYNTFVDAGVNPRWLDQVGASWELFDKEGDPDGIIVKILRDLGYEGVLLKDTDGILDFDSYAVFDPNNIKSADAVTFDANGNVIGIADRFNVSKADVRFQIVPLGVTKAGSKAFQKFRDSLPPDLLELLAHFEDIRVLGDEIVDFSEKGKRRPNFFSRFETTETLNAEIRKDPVKQNVMQRLYELIPPEMQKGPLGMRLLPSGLFDIKDIDAAEFETRGGKKTVRRGFILRRSIGQRIIDALPSERVSEMYVIPTAKGDVAINLQGSNGEIRVPGGEMYRRHLLQYNREQYRLGELKPAGPRTITKPDLYGVMGFLAKNDKTVFSGDFTTLCPQIYFNGGCKYCYRRSRAEKDVNNKLAGARLWYTGEILRLSDTAVTLLNQFGGLRIQSFGDWDIVDSETKTQLVDLIVDAEARMLQVKIITKTPEMIDFVAQLKDQGLGNNVFFNLSIDHLWERTPVVFGRTPGKFETRNSTRPFAVLKDENGVTRRDEAGNPISYWKRALSVEEAMKWKAKYPWVLIRSVALKAEEFVADIADPRVNVVTGYHGFLDVADSYDPKTQEPSFIEIEPIGDSGMPRFTREGTLDPSWEFRPKYDKEGNRVYKVNKKTGEKTPAFQPIKKVHRKLAKLIQEKGLQLEYEVKACCITGKCPTCQTKCGVPVAMKRLLDGGGPIEVWNAPSAEALQYPGNSKPLSPQVQDPITGAVLFQGLDLARRDARDAIAAVQLDDIKNTRVREFAEDLRYTLSRQVIVGVQLGPEKDYAPVYFDDYLESKAEYDAAVNRVWSVAKATRQRDGRVAFQEGESLREEDASQFSYGEDNDDRFYHVTTKDRIRSIRKKGLQVGSKRQFSTAATASNSKGRIFLTEREGVQFWIDRIAEQLEHSRDLDENESAEDFVRVVSVPKTIVKNPQEDSALEMSGAGRDFFTEDSIPGVARNEEGLFQDEERAPRGMTHFRDDKALIYLFRNANASTFTHEMAHVWFEEMANLAASGGGTPEFYALWKDLTSWLGVEPGMFRLTAEQHETFSQNWEAYLREGKAPTRELASAFEKFRVWLLDLYKQVTSIGQYVNMTDEVRSIFDRMLADERSIQQSGLLDSVTTQNEKALIGFNAGEKLTLRRIAQKAMDELKQEIFQQRAQLRIQMDKLWRKEALAQVEAEPVYRLLDELQNVGRRINREAILQVFGLELYSVHREKLDAITVTVGRNPDQVALENGYPDVEELINAILSAPSREARVQQIIDQKAAAFEDVASVDTALAENAAGLQYLTEMERLLSAKLGSPRASAEAAEIRAQVAQEFNDSDMLVADAIKTPSYIGQLRRMAVQRDRALARQDFETAAEIVGQMRKQYERIKRSGMIRTDVMDTVNRTVPRLLKVKLGQMDEEYRTNAHLLAWRFGLTKKEPDISKRRTTLAAILSKGIAGVDEADRAAAADSFINTDLPWSPELLDETVQVPYQQLPLPLMLELTDMLKHLVGRGRAIVQARDAFHKQRIEDLAEAAAAPASVLPDAKIRDTRTVTGKQFAWWDKYLAELDNLLAIFTRMDGFQGLNPGKEDFGPNRTLLYNRLAAAAERSILLSSRINSKLEAPYKVLDAHRRALPDNVAPGVPLPERLKRRGDSYWTFNHVLSLALNQGNPYNRDAVMSGYPDLTEAQVTDLLAVLSKEDLLAVQDIWDTINTLWPLLSEVYLAMNYFTPRKVEAEAVTINGVTLRGGYYPVAFDPRSREGRGRDAAELSVEAFNSTFPSVHTKKGMTVTRTNTGGRPLHLNASAVIAQHVKTTTDYITMTMPVRDVFRVTSHATYKGMALDKLGPDAYDSIRKILANMARGQRAPGEALDGFMNIQRAKATMYVLGANFAVATKQGLSITGYWKDFGVIPWLRGLSAATNPDNWAKMRRLSAYMDNRAQVIDGDVMEGIRDWAKKKGWAQENIPKLQALMFAPIRIADTMTTVPIWLGTYEMGMQRFNGDSEAAVIFANEAIAASQPSTRSIDLAPMQMSESTFVRIFSMFSSFTIRWGQRQRSNYRALRAGQISVAEYTRHTLYEWLLPMVMMNVPALAMAFMSGDDEEEEKALQGALADTVMYPFAGYPMVRDMVRLMASAALPGVTAYDRTITSPAFAFGKEVYGVAVASANLFNEDKEDKVENFLYSFTRLASYWIGVPAWRVWRFMKEHAGDQD